MLKWKTQQSKLIKVKCLTNRTNHIENMVLKFGDKLKEWFEKS